MSEYSEQVLLFQWADLAKARTPELGLLYAIPNSGGFSGGFKTNVVRVVRSRKSGTKKGVPDVCLPVPRGGYGALYLELKAKGGRVKVEQRAWLAALKEVGNAAHLCVGWEEARDRITEYLARPLSTEAA